MTFLLGAFLLILLVYAWMPHWVDFCYFDECMHDCSIQWTFINLISKKSKESD